MALVGKAGRGGGFRQRRPLGDHRPRPDEPTADLEAMWRGAEGDAEVPGEREAVETAHAFQLLRCDRPRRFGHEELPGPGDATKGGGMAGGRATRRSPGGVGARDQAFGQPPNDGIDGQRLQGARKIGESLVQDGGEGRIVGDGVGHEGGVTSPSAAEIAPGST